MKKIWTFITDSKNKRLVLLIGLFLIVFLFLRQCNKVNNLSENNDILLQNEAYYKDSLKLVNNKVGELQFERAVLITTSKKLKKDSSDLSLELKKQKGHIVYLNNIIIKLKNTPPDTIYNEIVKYHNGLYGLKWKLDEGDQLNYRILEGESRFQITDSGKVIPNLTIFSKDEIGISLYTGLVEKKGQLNIFVKSAYPGFVVTNLDGALIDPKNSTVLKNLMPKHTWVLGPSVSIGLMYNPKKNNVGPYIGIGIGITRRISKEDFKNIF